ncbi:MAG: peptidase C45 [Bacteroidetes bacterium]|nr:peptidase C45 [Bacteroidota bacterium]
MHKKKWYRRWWFYVLAGIVLLLGSGIIYLYCVAIVYPPEIADKSALQLQRVEVSPGFYTIGNNWFRKSKSGLFEMYTEGKPFERGVINGKLSRELVVRQEDHFNAQIRKMIPSDFYLNFLKYFVAWFNRHLAENVTEEDKEEIYGISESASDQYQYIGSNYQRILNYHAAHDIGHALQSMALVGCTSFATWGPKSEGGTLIAGRNFDFYVGDAFAQDKIVAFEKPDQGYKFMTVTWGGFIGAVSGMNEKGLAVTINAAKSGIPSGSATPVSLVAREILQYAKNISEAYAIAGKRKMFVSESFLISSAEDHKAVILEKTPDSLGMYDPQKDFIICANHFQSDQLKGSLPNKLQMEESASPYRYERVQELLNAVDTNTVEKTVALLRDQRGLMNADLGMGNEKAVNQLIAHHSIVFEPEKRLVWVSTAPWQLGPYVAYDLNKIFSMHGLQTDHELVVDSLSIPADTFLATNAYRNFVLFRNLKMRMMDGMSVDPDSLVLLNPSYYHAYVLAGDYLFKKKEFVNARNFYEQALKREIATKKEENYIRAQIELCRKK